MAVLTLGYCGMLILVAEGAFEFPMLGFTLGEQLKYIRVTGSAVFVGYIAGIMNV